MRVSILVMVTACLLVPSLASAALTEFPYEAVVQSDGVIVRSGPGERYDPTMKLGSGQRVTVHRHDPGGWYMIAPPPGSFSWIDASYVETTDDGRGSVKVPHQGDGLPPRVVVWIGSRFTNEHKYFGRQLATGDEVVILGEQRQETDRGPVTYYKIEPPRLEFRWVKGDFVLPLSEVGNIAESKPNLDTDRPAASDPSTPSDDPFAGPSFAAEQPSSPPGFPAEQGPTLLERELDRAIDSNAAVNSGPSEAQVDESRRQLMELDEQLRLMLDQGPGQWRLAEMAEAYRSLQSSASPGVAGMIDARLEAIEARKPIKAEYDAFVEITKRTEQRDAELLSLQNSHANGAPAGPNAVQLGSPRPFESPQRGPGETPSGPHTGGRSPVELGSGGIASPTDPASRGDLDQLDGAGIISRVPIARPGVPPHILVAPDGRLLAYLHAEDGVNLDTHLGQSVGVIGRRIHEPRLRSDLIIVQRLTPVRLQP